MNYEWNIHPRPRYHIYVFFIYVAACNITYSLVIFKNTTFNQQSGYKNKIEEKNHTLIP